MADDLVQIEIPELSEEPLPQPPPRHESEDDGRSSAAAEYALHILFTQFVRLAERKLAVFAHTSEDDVESVLGEGVDPEFDQSVMALSLVARRKPKPVVDSVMYWRKSKREHPATGSLASIYILTRVLMEVVRQTPPVVFGDDLSEKLEDIVFRQVATADASALAHSRARRANWHLLARLLGEMSVSRFGSVADRFVGPLAAAAAANSAPPAPLLDALPFLRLGLYPEDRLDESSHFMATISELVARTTPGSAIRTHYGDAIAALLEPLAETATVEVNEPTWADAMASLVATGTDRRGPHVPMAAAALCVSPRTLFSDHWMQLLESQAPKRPVAASMAMMGAAGAQPATTAPALFHVAAQLAWVYVFRYPESLNAMTRKIDALKRLLFGHLGRKAWQGLDSAHRHAGQVLLRILFAAYRQHTLDDVVFPLLVGVDAGHVVRRPTLALDAVVSERAALAVDAAAAMLADVREGRRPPFLRSALHTALSNYGNGSNTSLADSATETSSNNGLDAYRSEGSREAGGTGTESETDPENVKEELPPPLRDSFELFGSCVCQIAAALSDGRGHRSGVANDALELLSRCAASWPSWWPLSAPGGATRGLEVLTRLCVNAPSAGVRAAACNSLRLVGCDPTAPAPARVLAAVTRAAVAAADGPHAEPLLAVYVAVLEAWATRLARAAAADDVGVWSAVEEVEGNGVLFLCSRDRAVRALALRVLWLVPALDAALGQRPARVIELLQTTELAPLLDARADLSMPERARVARFRGRRSASLARLAGSDYGVDAALWLKVFPTVVRKCFEAHPVPVALFRSAACERLLALHDAVAELAPSAAPSAPSDDVVQWRLYLMAVCATLTSTAEQKMHVPAAHARKKSAQKVTLHHQRITSARSVFRMVAPLLGAAHPGVRAAAVAGLACTNVDTYRTLVEVLHPVLTADLGAVSSSSGSDIFSGHGGEATRRVAGIAEVLRLTTRHWTALAPSEAAWVAAELATVLQALRAVLAGRTNAGVTLGRVFCDLLADAYAAVGPRLVAGSSQQWAQFWAVAEQWSPAAASGPAPRAPITSAAPDAVAQARAELERRALDRAATRALAALLRDSRGLLRNVVPVLQWLAAVLAQPALDAPAKLALDHILGSHLGDPAVDSELFTRSLASRSARAYFLGACGSVATPSILAKLPSPSKLRLLAVALVKVGDSDCDTRLRAVESVQRLETSLWGTVAASADVAVRLRSSEDTVYKREMFALSQRVASLRASARMGASASGGRGSLGSGAATPMVAHLTRAFHVAGDATRRDVLSVLLPWVQSVDLSAASETPALGFSALDTSGSSSNGAGSSGGDGRRHGSGPHSSSLLASGVPPAPGLWSTYSISRSGGPDPLTASHSELNQSGTHVGTPGPPPGTHGKAGNDTSGPSGGPASTHMGPPGSYSGPPGTHVALAGSYSAGPSGSSGPNIGAHKLQASQSLTYDGSYQLNEDTLEETDAQDVLTALLEITVVFGDRMPHEVEALWAALCALPGNATAAAEFILEMCLRARSPTALVVASRVLVYLAAAPAAPARQAVTDRLLGLFEPRLMMHHAPPVAEPDSPAAAAAAVIARLLPAPELPPVAPAQLAVVFLVDTLVDPLPPPTAATVVHVALTMADHFVGVLAEKARELVLRVVGLALAASPQAASPEFAAAPAFQPAPPSVPALAEALATSRWGYEDDQGRVPEGLRRVTALVASLLPSEAAPLWPRTAVQWATACPVRHVASRSFQILRCLDPVLDQRMLGDMLARLSTTIAEPQLEIQGFAIQILMTLNAVTDRLPAADLRAFPQLFWATVAALATTNEREYGEALSVLSKLVARWEWRGGGAQALRSSYPSRWDGEFGGVLELVLRGLQSAAAAPAAWRVLDQLVSAPPEAADLLVPGDSTLPLLLAAYLPRFLHHTTPQPRPDVFGGHGVPAFGSAGTGFGLARSPSLRAQAPLRLQHPLQRAQGIPDRSQDRLPGLQEGTQSTTPSVPQVPKSSDKDSGQDIETEDAIESRAAASRLHDVLAPTDPALGRILDSVARQRFWSKSDLISQYSLALVRAFPAASSQILVLLMSMLPNRLEWVRAEVLAVLRGLLPEVDVANSELSGRGADVVSPLLRLLQTKDAEQALAVLDAAGPLLHGEMDRRVLRISLGGSRALLAKEYEASGSLYGLPDDSGWAVPDPPLAALRTRNNVHAVFYTCDATVAATNVQVQFQREVPGYAAPEPALAPAEQSQDADMGSMDHMLTVLDDLDSFFAQMAVPARPQRAPSVYTVGSAAGSDATPVPLERWRSGSESESFSGSQLYDKKVSVILNRSLARTPSQMSFRTSFADANVAPTLHQPLRQSVDSFDSHSTITDEPEDVSEPPTKAKSQAESSFRLESLLRGKRRSRNRRKSPEFQFP